MLQAGRKHRNTLRGESGSEAGQRKIRLDRPERSCVRMTPEETVAWAVITKRREGIQIYEKVVNCGCGRDDDLEKITIHSDRLRRFCFAPKIPCCAYIISGFTEIMAMITEKNCEIKFIPGN